MLINRFSISGVFILAGVTAAVIVFYHTMSSKIFNFIEHPAPYSTDFSKLITPASTTELEQLFSEANYNWPLVRQQVVPPLQVQSLPLDFSEMEMVRRRTVFLRVLLPLVLMENQKLRNQRALIRQMLENPDLAPRPDSLAEHALDRLIRRYRIDRGLSLKKSLTKLLIHVDEIPPSLVLAQGAIESGWGSSRFALQANSLFGEWTYQASQGLAPQSRKRGDGHYVRKFPDIYSSIRSYMYNLNTSKSYKGFRNLRAAMRRKQQPLKSMDLAAGLEKYSAKGLKYVAYVRKVIQLNDLQDLDELSLAIQVY